MKTLINQAQFLKAVEYVSEHFFSKPYSISPMVDRWFNQLAMIELENGKVLQLTGDLAKKHVDIILNDAVVPKKDIELVLKFHSKNSEFEKERIILIEKIEALTQELADPANEINEDIEIKRQELVTQEELLRSFDSDKIKAQKLYDTITAPNASVSSVLNEQSLEDAYKSKIKNIVHRPNHGLTHSVRAAYLTTAIHAFNVENKMAQAVLIDQEIEKLQMMMLFSVVGRRDETGFNDCGADGRATYKAFRTTSGREYLKYAQDHLSHLYGNDRVKMYQDAITVELMGYHNLQEAESSGILPEVFVDYVMKQNNLDREKALGEIRKGTYTLTKLYSNGEVLANAKMNMMKEAHAIDLTRCYPLYASKEGGPKSINIILSYLYSAGLYAVADGADEKKLTSAFKVLRAGFDTLELTGQTSTFGLISAQSFEQEKGNIINEIKAINKQFEKPIAAENYSSLMDAAKKASTAMDGYWIFSASDDSELLDCYRKNLISKATTARLTAADRLKPNIRMFQFQNTIEGNPHQIDHHKNALSLVNALQTVTPVPGVTQVELPVIKAVTHDKANNKVSLVFDSMTQALNFNETYNASFREKLPITQINEQQFVVEANREHYQQLVSERQVEFKQAFIPTSVNAENSLVDEEGNIEVLNLVSHSRALVRLVSTTALSGEDFPDYDYLLKSLEDPIHNRYTPALSEMTNFPVDRSKYYDPRSGESYIRTKPAAPPTEVRFQEPITTPKRFADKLSEGLSEKSSLGGGPKNTIFTKKLAHTLLPPHGKVIPFSGYRNKQSNYFPIGVLSDINQVELKDERYIWSQNMGTASKFWLRDTSAYNKIVYKLLNTKLDQDNNPIRYATGVIAYNKDYIQRESTPDVLIKYLEGRAEKILAKLNEKFYRPTPQAIEDFKMLLRQERKEYKVLLLGNKEGQKKLNTIYASLENRLQQEQMRNHPKYAITLRELIEQQKKTNSSEEHNEILAANTKGATKALYAPHDRLFDRLNLAFHALQIKKQYHYDIPLLVMSSDKPPYHYTEALIKADLKEAYKLIREGQFPFDKSLFPVYELDAKGNVVTKKGETVIKTNEKGKKVFEPKNLDYQRGLLVKLFQLGMPKLKNYSQLNRGQINKNTMDEDSINASIDSIINQMDVVGGLGRETELMNRIFAQEDEKKQQAFFLRAVNLGHTTLVDEILHKKALKLSSSILQKAILLADNNNHTDLKQLLQKNQEITTFKAKCEGFKPSYEGIASLETNIITINEIKVQFAQLSPHYDLSTLDPQIKQKENEVFLNSASINEKNITQLPDFIKLLNSYPEYKKAYAEILKSNQEVKLDQLIEANKRHDHDKESVVNALTLIAAKGWEVANNYLLLIEIRDDKAAAQYLAIQGEDSLLSEEVEQECKRLVEEIERQSMGASDEFTHDFCEAVRYAIEVNKNNYVGLKLVLQKIVPVHASVLSKEVEQECKRLVAEIEQQSMGASDEFTHDFCEAVRYAIKFNKENYVGLKLVLQKIVPVHAAVTSNEVKDVQIQIERLEHNAKSMFGIGNQKKADNIRAAVSKVSLLDRATLFSNADKPSCKEVRIALASNRMAFGKPVVDSEHNVVESNAAKSFANVKASFKKRLDEQKIDISVDKEGNIDSLKK